MHRRLVALEEGWAKERNARRDPRWWRHRDLRGSFDGTADHARRADHCARIRVVAALAAAGYGSLLHGFTDAANPFIDSTVLALSILAQLLMVARKIETWPVWSTVDCIAVPLYASKGLWLTAAVYAFFLVLVVMGWLRWSKLIGGGDRMNEVIA